MNLLNQASLITCFHFIPPKLVSLSKYDDRDNEGNHLIYLLNVFLAVTLIGTIGFESRLIKYDDSDVRTTTSFIYYVMWLEA
jgi:hypothetical protein